MKLSARNVFAGRVSEVTRGAVNTLVGLAIPGGAQIYSTITNDSVETLGLKKGDEAFAVLKATAVVVGADLDKAKISARNFLSGVVCKVVDGPVSAEIDIEVGPGVAISAVITHEGAQALGFKVGDKASAIFKASSVILGVK